MPKNPWKTCVVRRNMIHFIQSIFSVERGGHHSKNLMIILKIRAFIPEKLKQEFSNLLQ